MIKLQWHTEPRRVNDLIPYEHNPRKITSVQMRNLQDCLEEFGLVEIPVINLDATLIAGHQRCKAMQLLGRGDELIDVRVPNRELTERELKEYNLKSNAIKGDWLDDILREHFQEFDLGGMGIDLAEMETLHQEINAPEEGPEMPIVQKFSEKYSSFVIVSTNAIDENHLAELLQLETEQSYKGERTGRTHVISAKRFLEVWKSVKS